MKHSKTKRRRRLGDPIDKQIAEVTARARQLGIRLASERLTAWFPQARCTPEERERALKLAEAEGISLSELIRRRVISADAPLVVE